MLRLYNSLTRSKKIFKPLKDNTVTIYSCGPTVYDHAQIGNMRAFLFADILQRTLKYTEGYKVVWVMNITDVDDKMIARIQRDNPDTEPNQALGELADKYTDIFIEDMQKAGINRNDISKLPRATDNIEEMQQLIKKLLREEIAYVSDGSIYFNLKAYQESGKKYGQLVDLNYDAKARVIDDQDQKEGVGDFALWKARKEENGKKEPYWDFEWLGKNYPGRPGWHIECSVMSTKYLGKPFDIHTGGIDLKFPHHENEIAQCGGQQANFFLHNEFLNIEGEKMSKSVGNIITLQEISDPMAFRMLVLQAHYRTHMEFSQQNLSSAHDRLNNLRAYVDQLAHATTHQLPEKDDTGLVEKFEKNFKAALEDDLNTPLALAALSAIEAKAYSHQALEAIQKADEVLGLNLVDTKPLLSEARALLSDYEKARKAKEYVKSDQLRDKLKSEYNLAVADTKYGALVSTIRT